MMKSLLNNCLFLFKKDLLPHGLRVQSLSRVPGLKLYGPPASEGPRAALVAFNDEFLGAVAGVGLTTHGLVWGCLVGFLIPKNLQKDRSLCGSRNRGF